MIMEKDIKKIYELNAIKLAYMGDSVFSMYVRKHFIVNTDKKNADLNKCVNSVVCAPNQAKLMDIHCNDQDKFVKFHLVTSCELIV